MNHVLDDVDMRYERINAVLMFHILNCSSKNRDLCNKSWLHLHYMKCIKRHPLYEQMEKSSCSQERFLRL